MKMNLSALGDGIIVVGLSLFFLSIASIYYQSVQQSIATATTADALRSAQQGMTVVTGLFALGGAILVAGALKIVHAFSSLRDEKQSNLKTPVVATATVLLLFYFLSFSLIFGFGRF